ncbi:MAG TPA: pantoate--beta-alanine ligase [Thermoanaerobaculia bacterium]|nr:pantoate--beta-alanine ligase [Thermoanaerobaculia bacterium]
MKVLAAVSDVRAFRASREGSLGLVPTMGALHAGHLSLVARARNENDHVAASIFVNPAQFGPAEDFAAYPRALDTDLGLLASLGVDAVWAPSPGDVYPPGFQTWITVEDVSAPLEGTWRPGHFRGVATVVAKLLNVFQPARAYFGQKDAQQVAVIRRMVQDLSFPADVVVCPIVREKDGLALSSRNLYLGPDERRAAPVLHRALEAAHAAFDSGERDASRLRAILTKTLAGEPLVREDYVSVADAATLAELSRVEGSALVSLAARIGKTRLIDNIVLGET